MGYWQGQVWPSSGVQEPKKSPLTTQTSAPQVWQVGPEAENQTTTQGYHCALENFTATLQDQALGWPYTLR